MVARGYASLSFLRTAAEHIGALDVPTYLIRLSAPEAVPEMFVEGVHGRPLIRADKHNPPSHQPERAERPGIPRAKPLAS
jgi:hypothetical protein